MLESNPGNSSLIDRLIGKGIGDYGRAGYDRGGHSAEKSSDGPAGTPFSALMLAPQLEKRSYHLGAIQPRLLQDMDANGDGQLDETEFKGAVADTKFGERLTTGTEDKDAVMSRLFSKLDGNGDGNLTAQEASDSLAVMHANARMALDADQDGVVTRDERLGFRSGFKEAADQDGNGHLSQTERASMRGEMMRTLLGLQEETNAKTPEDELLDFLTGKTDEDPLLATAA